MKATDPIRAALEEMTRDELNVHARRLKVPNFRDLNKAELIEVLSEFDEIAALGQSQTWWWRYHNHVYGWASLTGLVFALVVFFMPERTYDTRPTSISTSLPIESVDTEVEFSRPLNRNDYKRRNALLGINENEGGGQFKGIDYRVIEALLREHFLDPNDKQNEAPTAKEILSFMQRHPTVLAHGYATSPNREDYRVTLTGIHLPAKYAETSVKLAALEFCVHADKIDSSEGVYCWWD